MQTEKMKDVLRGNQQVSMPTVAVQKQLEHMADKIQKRQGRLDANESRIANIIIT